jgi:pimeloyl-ACP methyl ester carboxylesterase
MMIRHLQYRGPDGWPLYAALVEASPPAAQEQGHAPLVLLHGGGPDHESLLPLARLLAEDRTIILPDVRGYGLSVCDDPSRHTWQQYSDDVAALLDHLGYAQVVLGGAGLGATISLRAALSHAERVSALVLISVEDIEDDAAKQAEIAFMDAFAARVRDEGIEAAWEPILPELAPVIGAMVRDAIPRSDPGSIAAAAAIGRDRSFRNVEELAGIAVPTLVFPGMDFRHPAELADGLARMLPNGQKGEASFSAETVTAEQFGQAFAPPIRRFLADLGE